MPGHLVALSSGLRELRVGGCFDQFWQRLEDLVFRVVDVAQAMEERSSMLLTSGRGADACIDAVGTEPHSTASFDSVIDRVKVATFMGTDRPHVCGRRSISGRSRWSAY
jgi:hypothetical protein